MKILYVAGLTPNDTSLYRMWALERLGHTIIPVNAHDYRYGNPVAQKVFLRLAAGPMVARLNRDLLNLAAAERPDLLWTDKLLSMLPGTLDRMRTMGIATVSYMIDNPFGPRQDPGWRLYMKDIPHYDLHVVQRDKNILDYRQRGARDVIKIQTAYEPTLQYPPPDGWSDVNRNREVSFVGTPYDQRAETLSRLANLNEFGVTISGNARAWKKALGEADLRASIVRASYIGSSIERLSGAPKSISASSPIPIWTSSFTRALKSQAAAASCWPSAPMAICSVFKREKRLFSSLPTRNW